MMRLMSSCVIVLKCGCVMLIMLSSLCGGIFFFVIVVVVLSSVGFFVMNDRLCCLSSLSLVMCDSCVVVCGLNICVSCVSE